MFPNFIGLTWENQKTFFSMFLTFRDPNKNYLKLCGCQFFHGTRLWSKGSATGEPRGPSMAHATKFLGRVGPAHSPLVAPMPLIFVLMDPS
jgi:hypothetical protein